MYIKNLRIQDVKLLRDVEISFVRDGKPRMWTVLLGENGLCKTTILQAIALAASGPDRANQLADVRSYPDRRNEKDHPSTISALFGFGATCQKRRAYPGLDPDFKGTPDVASTLTLFNGLGVFLGNSSYLDQNSETIKYTNKFNSQQLYYPLQESRARGLPHWFVAGYGVTRSLPSPMSSEGLADPVLDRLAPLFDRGRLIGTGFLELFESTEVTKRYIEELLKAIISKDDKRKLLPKIATATLGRWNKAKKTRFLPESHQFGFQSGKKSVNIPANWLSHGYQSMIAWVADLVGQIFWDAGGPLSLEEMEGLVLIDELDIHLHPAWQLGLIGALKSTFPRIQFVATTHSPMLLPGLDQDEILHIFQDEEGNVQIKMAGQSPSLMTGSEIYGSFFGIDQLYPIDVGADLQRYGYLSSDPSRTDEEDRELSTILAKLRNAGIEPDWLPTPRKSQRGNGRRKHS